MSPGVIRVSVENVAGKNERLFSEFQQMLLICRASVRQVGKNHALSNVLKALEWWVLHKIPDCKLGHLRTVQRAQQECNLMPSWWINRYFIAGHILLAHSPHTRARWTLQFIVPQHCIYAGEGLIIFGLLFNFTSRSGPWKFINGTPGEGRYRLQIENSQQLTFVSVMFHATSQRVMLTCLRSTMLWCRDIKASLIAWNSKKLKTNFASWSTTRNRSLSLNSARHVSGAGQSVNRC